MIAEEMTLEDAAREAAGNWRTFESFAWHDKPEDAESFAIVYTHNRDSDILTRCNAEDIAEALAPFDEDVIPEHHSHFACGWVDGFAIRVYRADGTTTEAFRTYWELLQRIADYPILDESRLSAMEAEEIESAWGDWAQDDYLRALGKRFGVETNREAGDLRKVFDTVLESSSAHWAQDGSSMSVDIDRVARETVLDDALPYLDTTLPDESAAVVSRLLSELLRRPDFGVILAGAGIGSAAAWSIADELTAGSLHPQSAADLAAVLWSMNSRPEVCAALCAAAGCSFDQFSFAVDELELIGAILDK